MRRFATARLSRSSQRGARYRCGASELTPGQSRRVSGQTGAHRVVANGEKWRGRFAQGLRGMERTGIEPVTSGLQSGGRLHLHARGVHGDREHVRREHGEGGAGPEAPGRRPGSSVKTRARASPLPGPRIAELIAMSSERADLEERPRDDGQHPNDERERKECADERVHSASLRACRHFRGQEAPCHRCLRGRGCPKLLIAAEAAIVANLVRSSTDRPHRSARP